MRRRCHIAILAVVASLSLACGGNTPTAPSAPATPSPSPSASPQADTMPVRLTIAAYDAQGSLTTTWGVQARVTLEAVPVCTTGSTATLSALANVKEWGVTSDGTPAPKRLTELTAALSAADCKLPAWVDWDLSGAACQKRGDVNGGSLGVQCTTVGELRVEAVSRGTRSGPEIARGTGQFRVTP